MVMNQIKQSAGKILSNVKKQIKLDSIMLCDSALLSLENIQLISNLKWITRVPMTLKKTKEIIGYYLEKVKLMTRPNYFLNFRGGSTNTPTTVPDSRNSCIF